MYAMRSYINTQQTSQILKLSFFECLTLGGGKKKALKYIWGCNFNSVNYKNIYIEA